MLNILRNCRTVFRGSCTILPSIHHWNCFQFPHNLTNTRYRLSFILVAVLGHGVVSCTWFANNFHSVGGFSLSWWKFFLSFKQEVKFFILFIIYLWERDIDLLFHLFMHSLVASCMCLSGDQTRNIWMYHDDALTNWIAQPGPKTP